jgi:hypothetical protein
MGNSYEVRMIQGSRVQKFKVRPTIKEQSQASASASADRYPKSLTFEP